MTHHLRAQIGPRALTRLADPSPRHVAKLVADLEHQGLDRRPRLRGCLFGAVPLDAQAVHEQGAADRDHDQRENDLAAWLETVADVAVASATGDLNSNVAGQFVCVAYVYPDGTSAEDQTVRLVEQSGARQVQTGQTCFTDGRPSDERRVQVQLIRDTDIEAVLFSQTITLNANSVTRFERAAG